MRGNRVIVQCLVVAVLALGPIASGQCHAQEVRDTIKETFKVRPGGTLFLDVDHGDVEVLSARGSEVLIEIERIAETSNRSDASELFERHDVSFEQRGGDIHLRGRFEEASSPWSRWRDRGKLRTRVFVRVPERFNVDFTSGAGNIDISSLEGTVQGSTGAGNLKINSVRGVLELSSGAGNVQISETTGRVEVSTGAGNVELRGVQGALEIRTGAGNVTARITRQPEGDSSLESGAGNVTVFVGQEVGVDVDAQAGMGSIQTDFPLRIEGSWMKKSSAGSINGGGPALHMRTGVGNVEVRRL